MKDIAEAILQVAREISREKGDFLLVSLVLRDRSQDAWDLVLSAFWFPIKQRQTLEYVVDKLKTKLSKKDFLKISKIVLLDPTDPFVLAVTSAAATRDSICEVVNSTFNGIGIDHMFLITSQRPVPAKSQG